MNNKYFSIFLLLLAYLTLGLIYPFLATDIIKYLLYQIIFIALPSYKLAEFLIPSDDTTFEKIIMGYPISLFIILITNGASNYLAIPNLSFIMIIFSIWSLISIIKRQERFFPKVKRNTYLILNITLVVYLTLSFVTYIIPNGLPTPDSVGLIYKDSLWMVGSTWSVIRGGFPFIDARADEIPYYYHMLQNIIHATNYSVTQIDPFYLLCYLGPIFNIYILICTLIIGSNKFLEKNTKITLFLCLAFLFTAGGYFHHIFSNPLTFSFGLHAIVLMFLKSYEYFKHKTRLDILYFIILFIIIGTTKVILLLVIPPAFGVVFLYRLFAKREFNKRELILGIAMIVALLCIKEMYYGDVGGISLKAGLPNSTVFNFLKDTFKTVPLKMLESVFALYLCIKFLPRIAFWPAILFVMLLFRSDFRKELRFNREYTIFCLSFIIFCIVGANFLGLSAPGAETYLYWYAMIGCNFLVPLIIPSVFHKKRSFIKPILFATISYQLLMFVWSIASSYQNPGYYWWPGFSNRVPHASATIDYGEWKGLTWLKENTPTNSIILSDRHQIIRPNRIIRRSPSHFFGYSAISGRQLYAEGTGYLFDNFQTTAADRWNEITKFLESSDRKAQEALLESFDVDFMIHSLRFREHDYSNLTNIKPVYRNNSIVIYKINK